MIATLSFDLAARGRAPFNESVMLGKVRSLLAGAGYVPASGVIETTRLQTDLMAFYGIETLRSLNLEPDSSGRCTWLDRAVERSHRVVRRPLHYILLLAMFRRSWESFDSQMRTRGVSAPKCRSWIPVVDVDALLAGHKRQIEVLLRADATLTRSEVRKSASHACVYIRKVDPDWLETVLPRSRRFRAAKEEDWARIDQDTLRQLEQALEQELLGGIARPRRISIHTLATAAGIAKAMLYWSETPCVRSRAFAAAAIETTSQFRRRQFRWAAAESERLGLRPTWKEFRSLAVTTNNLRGEQLADGLAVFRSLTTGPL